MSAKFDKNLTWICPKCGKHYYGWSTLKICNSCNYKEKDSDTFTLKEKREDLEGTE